jgi:crotonobetainyl-CoA:carnitine CoA-transferase CaiB-like acyl-CoA transferase
LLSLAGCAASQTWRKIPRGLMTAQETERRGGPHAGIRIVGIAGLGVTPCGCMMLADVGADAVRIEVSQ